MYDFRLEIIDFLKEELNLDYKKDYIYANNTILDGEYIDFYFPELNLAINGIRLWKNFERYGKYKNYFIELTNKAMSKNIELIQIMEDEWFLKQDIVKSIIKNKLKKNDKTIYARKCEIKDISTEEYKVFCNDNHIQGFCGASIKHGLFYNDELCMIASYSKPRFNKNYDYELVRVCSSKYTNVIGGLSKLFKHFLKDNSDKTIVCYCDLRYGTGLNSYGKIGFNHSLTAKPNYYYIKWGIMGRDTRIKFQKHKLHKVLEFFDPNTTEVENMYNNGYERIFDCGNNVFVYSKQEV